MNRPQWEAYAPQNEEVIQVLDRLKHICGGAEVENGWALKREKKQEAERVTGDNDLSKGVVGLYLRLRADVDENEEAEDDDLAQEAKHELSRLREYQAHCDTVAGDIGRITSLLRDISAYQALACNKTSNLHQTCNQLLEEHEELQQRGSKLREPLSYFNKLDELGKLLGMPMIASSMRHPRQHGKLGQVQAWPGSDAFLEALSFTEASINHFEQHPEYKDGAIYLEKFLQLRLRALNLIKDQVTGYLEKAGKAASAEETSGKPHLFEASLIYTKFRAVSHKVSESMKLLHDARFPQVFTECQERYFQIRLSLLRPAVRSYLNDVLGHNDLVSMSRFGAVYFMRLCQLEIALYSSCGMVLNDELASDLISEINFDGGDTFIPLDTETSLLMGNLQTLCEELYYALRPKILHEDRIDKLSELISVCQEELVQVSRDVGQSRALTLEVALDRLVRDTQERVILLAHKMISSEIRDFKPDVHHLDYPAILTTTNSEQQIEGDDDDVVDHSITADDDDDTHQPLFSDTYKTWYPPLNTTLTLLSKLYGVVDTTVFEEVARSTVVACTASLVAAAPNIPRLTNSDSSGRLRSDGDPAPYLHRQLFLIKHLITLQEQLVPFNIHFLQSDRRLSFHTTRSALRRLLGGRLNNVRQGLPHVYEVETDMRRDMEVALMESCNRFVDAVVEASTKPISSFLVKAKAFQDRSDIRDDDHSKSSPLLQEPFAEPVRVIEILSEAYETVLSNLTLSKEILSLWLQNKATESTLMNTVKRRVSDTIREMRVMLGDCYPVQNVAEFADPLERIMAVADELGCTSPHPFLSPSTEDPYF